jgi:hypothetical protein
VENHNIKFLLNFGSTFSIENLDNLNYTFTGNQLGMSICICQRIAVGIAHSGPEGWGFLRLGNTVDVCLVERIIFWICFFSLLIWLKKIEISLFFFCYLGLRGNMEKNSAVVGIGDRLVDWDGEWVWILSSGPPHWHPYNRTKILILDSWFDSALTQIHYGLERNPDTLQTSNKYCYLETKFLTQP